jgi:hypothetical protein
VSIYIDLYIIIYIHIITYVFFTYKYPSKSIFAHLKPAFDVGTRFMVRFDICASYTRKFSYVDFPTQEGCRRATLAYVRETAKVLSTFESLRGKAGLQRKLFTADMFT